MQAITHKNYEGSQFSIQTALLMSTAALVSLLSSGLVYTGW